MPDYSKMSDDELKSEYNKSNSLSGMIDVSKFEEKPSKLNAGQEIMLGLMPDDNSRSAYLQQEFIGSNIIKDESGEIKVDGAPVNPRGLDFGDVLRSLGYAIPFASQVAGSIASTAAAIPAGPGAMIGAGFAGGVASATAGEAVRIGAGKFLLEAYGKHFDLNDDGKTFINALSETAKSAAIGESVGVGMIGGGIGLKALSKTQFYKGASDAWTKTVSSIIKKNENISKIFKFIGNIPEDSTRIVLRDKPSVVLKEKYFDSNRTSNIVSKTLFGDEDFYSINSISNNGLKLGTNKIVKSIKEVDDNAYEELLTMYGVSRETIDGIRSSNIDNVLSPINTRNPRRGYELASKVIDDIKEKEKFLGEAVFKAESRAINNKNSIYFNSEELVKSIDSIIGSGDLLSNIRVPGYVPKPALHFPGSDKVKELSDILKGNKTYINSAGVKVTEKSKTPFKNIPSRQFMKIKKQFDAKVDEIFMNGNIPSPIKAQVKDIAKGFRSTYYEHLGIGDEALLYSKFKDITDGIKLEGRNAYTTLENKISSFNRITGSEQDELINALANTKNGSRILSDMNDYVVSKSIRSIEPDNILKSLSANLSSNRFLVSSKIDTPLEGILRDISKRMGAIDGSMASRRVFAEEAERSLAAKSFLASNQNLLRLQTLASMIGVGGLISGGPLGAIVGSSSALIAANPVNLGKLLLRLEKNKTKSKIINNIVLKRKINNLDKSRAVLSALISIPSRN